MRNKLPLQKQSRMVRISSANHLEMVFQGMDFSCSPTKYLLNQENLYCAYMVGYDDVI